MTRNEEARKLVDILYEVNELTEDELLMIAQSTHASTVRRAIRLINEFGYKYAEKHVRKNKSLLH